MQREWGGLGVFPFLMGLSFAAGGLPLPHRELSPFVRAITWIGPNGGGTPASAYSWYERQESAPINFMLAVAVGFWAHLFLGPQWPLRLLPSEEVETLLRQHEEPR